MTELLDTASNLLDLSLGMNACVIRVDAQGFRRTLGYLLDQHALPAWL